MAVKGMTPAPILKTHGLDGEHAALLQELLVVHQIKLARNLTKTKYYDAKNKLKDLNIAIPPQLRNVETVVGWPAKGVTALANRSTFDGFVMTDEALADQVASVLAQNKFKTTYSQAVISELVHSCAFVTVSKGNVAAGEPKVLISAYSAEKASAIWDYRAKRIKAGMTITESNADGVPTAINLYTDAAVLTLEYDTDGWHLRNTATHKMKRPLLEALVYNPTLDRPFGRSRITRAVMSLTDSAVRAALRAEVASEFFTSPQRYLLGADEKMFEGIDKWQAYLGSMLAVSRDEDGEIPQYGQLPSMSMQPHVEYMRSLAAQFAGETSLPISSLGIVQDNPASAEAIYAAKEDLIIEAQNLNDSNGEALRAVCCMIIATITEQSYAEASSMSISAKFRSPAMPSVVSQSDAMVKQIAAIPWIAESRVALEELGYSESQIERLMSDKRKAGAGNIIAALAAADIPNMEEVGTRD